MYTYVYKFTYISLYSRENVPPRQTRRVYSRSMRQPEWANRRAAVIGKEEREKEGTWIATSAFSRAVRIISRSSPRSAASYGEYIDRGCVHVEGREKYVVEVRKGGAWYKLITRRVSLLCQKRIYTTSYVVFQHLT